MPRKPTGCPNGRPQKEISLAAVERLAGMACTQVEVASWFNCSVDTLSRREGFAEAYSRGLSKGKISLRRAQFKSALAGSGRMLTWLGMQLLGQRNQTSTELSGPDKGPIETKIDLTKLSNDQLSHLESLLTVASVVEPGEGGEMPPRVQ